jgi:glutamyl-tRNA synthetase
MLKFLKTDGPQDCRIAPSPTGNAHIGLVRTAYLNYLAAKRSGGKFILRIDDTDKARSTKEFEDNILRTFEWLGLEWDAIYHQSQRYERYKELAEAFIRDGCAERKDGAVYFKMGDMYAPAFKDVIQGVCELPANDKVGQDAIKNLVLLRADGSPTYHWASCVDDVDMGIDLIIRGTDHFTNTFKHIQLFGLLNNTFPWFAHVGLIFFNGKKISKRDGISSMEYYRERYSPEAVLNAVLKLGWSHPNPKFDKEFPLVTKEMAIKLFPEGQLKAAKSTLDLNKLDWLNKKYVKSN